MSIKGKKDLEAMRRVSKIVAVVLNKMRSAAKAGMTTRELDNYGKKLMKTFGARPAPKATYGFPGWACISVNNIFCHGIPSKSVILKEGDLINIDVSAEYRGYWSDNGASFVIGKDIKNHKPLLNSSRRILKEAIYSIHPGMRVSALGALMEKEAAKDGFKVIRNLAGHGIGRSLHEEPDSILNCASPANPDKFYNGQVVAIETFISTDSEYAVETEDQWSMTGDKGGYMAQHEHTIVITENGPIILTAANGN